MRVLATVSPDMTAATLRGGITLNSVAGQGKFELPRPGTVFLAAAGRKNFLKNRRHRRDFPPNLCIVTH